jgi:type IV secretion system protein VirD4
MSKGKLLKFLIAAPAVLFGLLYAGGYVAQLIKNYNDWQASGASIGGGTAPAFPNGGIAICLKTAFDFPHGVYGIVVCAGALAALIMYMTKSDGAGSGYDRDRNINYSEKGTYGTAGFMTKNEVDTVVDTVRDIRKHHGTILGKIGRKIICFPENSMLNSNIAVYGASGSKKTRAFCVNMILQCVSRGESLITIDVEK